MKKIKASRENDNAVYSFSGGRTSAFMTIKGLELKNDENTVVIFANTGKENEATLKFVNECDLYIQRNFGKSIVWLEYNPNPELWFNIVDFETASRNGEPFSALIAKRKYLPNRVAR